MKTLITVAFVFISVLLWFLCSHWSDELGPWYDWFQVRDSVSREYYKFQYPST